MTRKALHWVALALVGLLPRPGQAYAQAYARARAVPLSELVGEWVGKPVGTPGPSDSLPVWHLVLQPDSTYVWKAHSDYTGLAREPFPRWLWLRGDTLALDSTHVYTVQLRRPDRGQLPELQLTELTAGGAGPVYRLAREWSSTAVTGRPLRCTNGRIGSFACANVELLSYLPKAAIGNSAGYDMWGWHDSATGREFLITGGEGTAFLDVTDPVHPKYLGVLQPHDPATAHICFCGQQSVKVYRHYAFITYDRTVTQSGGLQIFDLTQLREVKTPTTFRETAYYAGFDYTHTLTLNQETGLLTANGSNTCGGGLHMVDVRTPTQPVYLGCYTELTVGGRDDAGYVHDAQCVRYRGPDRPYQGREICVTYNAMVGRVVIADVTDRQQPKTISSATYPIAPVTHQGWFTADQRYVFLNDEYDESTVFYRFGRDSVRTRTIGLDLADLDDPVVLVEYFNRNSKTTDHNLYINGRYMYQGNYGAGLRIIDVADPKSPKEVGYLSPKHNDASDKAYEHDGGWVGPQAWGTYPYFKHGVVAVSLTSGVALVRLLKSKP